MVNPNNGILKPTESDFDHEGQTRRDLLDKRRGQ